MPLAQLRHHCVGSYAPDICFAELMDILTSASGMCIIYEYFYFFRFKLSLPCLTGTSKLTALRFMYQVQPHTKHTYGPPLPLTGIALLFDM
jgi:hypothetical protein